MPSFTKPEIRDLVGRCASLAALVVFLSALWSCQLSQDPKVENTASFDQMYETLSQFDTVVIVFKDPQGNLLDTAFQGTVDSHSKIHDLKVDGWDGGQVRILISGFNAGQLVYQVEKRFDGNTNQTDATINIVLPDAEIRADIHDLLLAVGDSLVYPSVKVLPSSLSDKTVIWSSSYPEVLAAGPGGIKALKSGYSALAASLQSAPNIKTVIQVTVGGTNPVPESISITPESLQMTLGGPAYSLNATVYPAFTSKAVLWSSEDTSIAAVDSLGRVKAIRKGETYVWAASGVRPTVRASAHVRISENGGFTQAERIFLPKDTIELVAGREPESVSVSVLPKEAEQTVSFSVSDPGKISVVKGKVAGSESGLFLVFIQSAANPLAKDTLYVKVLPPVPNDTIAPSRPTVRVNPIGPTRERRPTWTWRTGGNGGSGHFQYKLDDVDFSTGAASTVDTFYRAVSDLEPGIRVLYVRERDAAGNWSQAGSAQLDIDTTGPNVPRISGTTPTSAYPRWIWSSGGGGGMGLFRYRLGEAIFPLGTPESRDTAYALTSASTGTTYTLYVEERDSAGNWSPPASLAIKYDLTKPTVAIQSPLVSGTYVTALDTVTVSGICGGPNAISKVEYSVDGASPTAISFGAAGDWVIHTLKLTNAKTTAIKVTASDNLGNTGEAQLTILRDSDLPTPPTQLSNPVTPTNVDLATWMWGPGSDGNSGSGLNGKYRWKLNTGIWFETNSSSASGVALTEGTNIFLVQEQDRAGNWSASASDTVVLDTKAPDAVAFTGTNNAFTSNRQPIWSWSPSALNGGIGSYAATLEGPDGTKDTVLATTSYKPSGPLSDGTYRLTIRQKDQVAGVLGSAASFTINIDGTLPLISVTGKANGSTTSLGNTNTATLTGSIVDNGSGLSASTWELSGGTTKGPATVVNAGSFSIGIPTMTNHATTTVTLKATDKAGNTSAYTLRFAIEVPAPTVEWLPGSEDDGFITSGDRVTVKYSLNGGPAVTDTIMLTEAAQPDAYTINTKTITATNAINETETSTRIFYRVYKNVRFFTPDGKPYFDCKSWKYSCAFDGSVSGLENMILWLGNGVYAIASSFNLPIGATIKGQLKGTSKTSLDTSTARTVLSSNGFTLGITNTRLENLSFTFNSETGGYFLTPGVYNELPGNPWAIINHCRFDGINGGSSFTGAAIHAAQNNLSLSITETTFSNINNPDGAGIYIYGANNTLTFTKCVFSGNRTVQEVYNGNGLLTVDRCTPTKPITYPDLTCAGNVCTSQ